MLTNEVMEMVKKALLLLAALLLCAAANLRAQWDYEVAGETLALGCSARVARRAEEAARCAAEEILAGKAALPEAKRHMHLTLRRPAEDAPALTEALLRATPGVALRETVYLGDRRVGAVTDAAAFRRSLRAYIENTVPDWAWGGMLPQPLRVERSWGRTGYASTPGDMVLLVTGIAPVLYYDAEGNYSTV